MQFTDGQGRFELSGFAAGRYGITARKPGFFSPSRLDWGRSVMFVSVKGDMSDIVLKLVPEGIISGRVTDENGEPMEGVGMRVRGWRIINGWRREEEFSEHGTDQDGQFRFYGLMPGTYYLTASVMSERSSVSSVGFPGAGGYPTTYFPGVTQFNAATPIKLEAGQSVQADFALHRLPAFQVTGEVTGYSGGRLQWLQMVENFDPSITLPVELNRATGTFVARGVPAGSYTLAATAEEQTGRRLVGQATVNVASSNVSGIVVVVGPAVSIPVILQTESDNPSASRNSVSVTVQLSVAGGGGQNFFNQGAWSGPTEDKDHGGLLITSVQPGRYNVEVTPTGGWYVQSLLSGSTDLFAEPLTIGTGGSAVTIQALLRDDGATLGGEVRSGGNAAAATVLAVMQGAPLRTPWVVNSNNQGGFRFENLPPGDYVVLAFDNIADLEYANRGALRDYLSQGTAVTLGSKDSKTVNVELIRR
jgi:hypothetical protein